MSWTVTCSPGRLEVGSVCAAIDDYARGRDVTVSALAKMVTATGPHAHDVAIVTGWVSSCLLALAGAEVLVTSPARVFGNTVPVDLEITELSGRVHWRKLLVQLVTGADGPTPFQVVGLAQAGTPEDWRRFVEAVADRLSIVWREPVALG